MKKFFLILCYILSLSAAYAADYSILDEGVSWQLASRRKALVRDVRYDLSFCIPEDKTIPVEGKEKLHFVLRKKDDVVLDFRESADKIHFVEINGKSCRWQFVNDHIVIPSRYVRKGENLVSVGFTAGNQSLNRRDGYVYTLFVPDRARTVFPCFDQPNIKGRFNLSLDVPKHWKVVSNNCPDTPIPTYLFAFAAGDFRYDTFSEDGYTIGAYHRETDSLRVAQLPEIMHQVVFSLKWQEDFTGIKYPFPKYDLVILPGFQFGGMEHVGATFYNDNTVFLPPHPTPDERLRRTELISHETSHMWFGDAVTMDWFDDVWTKEVFANYFAAEITEPLFPNLNHRLNWLKTYVNAAITQDRTEGRTSIRQPLDNLRNAGLVYNYIIYNKAPVMMRKMVELMGQEAFRRGIQRYVRTYLYGNATWNDLIDILDSETPADLKTFSREWVDEAHWPRFTVNSLADRRIGMEYGYCDLSSEQCDTLIGSWALEPDGARRQALLMALNENYLNHKFDDSCWLKSLVEHLEKETDPLTSLTLVGYMAEPLRYTCERGETFDLQLLRLSAEHPLPAVRTQVLRLLIGGAQTPQVVDSLYALWQCGESPLLSENDFMTLSYELAVRKPERADEILECQRLRISNSDRRAQFDFVARAVSPRQAERDSLFASLAVPENRRIEPWTRQVLYYLNHPLRQREALKYIYPALELLPEVQRTGDIFFPGDWCISLLAGHRSPEAYAIVEDFLASHRHFPQLLANKILYAKYPLQRSCGK